jgi:multiple antibiotic resistance protein
MIDVAGYIKIFATLLAIVNPLGVIPIYVSLTRGSTEQERRHIARKTSITVAVILISAALAGRLFLSFFGISIASFRVGGGILLLLMSIHMMQARHTQSKQTPEEAEEAEEKESIAVVPIGMPLLAGPGAISTVIIYAHSSFEPLPLAAIIISSLLVAILTWTSLSIANPISKAMSKTAINIATRLMGLLLAAIAVEFIAGGLGQLFPGLAVYQGGAERLNVQ